jgi:hypothetical protein
VGQWACVGPIWQIWEGSAHHWFTRVNINVLSRSISIYIYIYIERERERERESIYICQGVISRVPWAVGYDLNI